MNRGEVWTVAGGGGYAGKPRPVVVIQNDRFDGTDSVTICGFTTDPTAAPLFRLLVEPTATNGLQTPSSVMVDKITTVPRVRLGTQIGHLSRQDLLRLNQAIIVFLGLVEPPG